MLLCLPPTFRLSAPLLLCTHSFFSGGSLVLSLSCYLFEVFFWSLSLSLYFSPSLSMFTHTLYIYIYIHHYLSLSLSLSLFVFLFSISTSISLIPCAFAFNGCLLLYISLSFSLSVFFILLCASLFHCYFSFFLSFLPVFVLSFVSFNSLQLHIFFLFSMLSFGLSGGPTCHGTDLSHDMWAFQKS